MSFLKWQKILAGTFEACEPVDERTIRAKLREFAYNADVADWNALDNLADDGDYYPYILDAVDLSTVPWPIADELDTEYTRCRDLEDEGLDCSVRLSQLTKWYLEELRDLVRPYYEGEEQEEEWIEYDEEDREEYGEEGYWYQPEAENPCYAMRFHVWQKDWDKFYETLHWELKEELER